MFNRSILIVTIGESLDAGAEKRVTLPNFKGALPDYFTNVAGVGAASDGEGDDGVVGIGGGGLGLGWGWVLFLR